MSETDNEAPSRRPRHPWVVGLLALLWSAMGALDHVLTQTLHEAGLVAGAVHDLALSNGAEIMGTVGVVFTASIFVIAALLTAHAWSRARRGVPV